MTKINLNLYKLLAAAFGGKTTHVPAIVDVSELLDFNDIYEIEQDLDDLLDDQHMVACVWTIDHVRKRRPDLNDEQAWTVLCRVRADFETDECHLNYIENTANSLFPPRAEAKHRLADQLRCLLRQVEALPEDERSDPAAYGEIAVRVDAAQQAVKGA